MAGERCINQALHASHPNRTLEAIKGHRRHAHYKESVERALEELRRLETASSSPCPSIRQNSGDLNNTFLTAISNTNDLPDTGYNIANLKRICCQAKDLNRNFLLEEISLYVREIFPAPNQQRR
ncbi:hypothetical protein M0804_015312 [Polistes exclamans]|nr:hypothetical protein M0804_015312 [Polistes exclamans]